MNNKPFKPHHMNVQPEDLAGNNGIGRYILLPGSDGRAMAISRQFDNLEVKSHPRGHHLYLGTISDAGKTIDVAAIASGMGCPSMEIILHELFHLGGKRFLRIGTAGSLQPRHVKMGDYVNVLASVRDECTTTDYLPVEIPAVASLPFVQSILQASEKLGLRKQLHTGTVHCKSSFYAREFGAGPIADKNNAYIDLLANAGVLATEMETAALFIQSQLYNHQLIQQGQDSLHRVLCAALLAIVAIPPTEFATPEQAADIVNREIDLALESIKQLASNEKSFA